MPALPVPAPSVETRASWVVAVVALIILAIAYGAPLMVAVALKPIAADLGTPRSAPALAVSLSFLGAGLGGILMGWLTERLGVRRIVMFGSVMIAAGMALSASGGLLTLYVGYGVLMGLFGASCMFSPLMTYVSRWFDRRRGTAMALISSGQYIAGVVWPSLIQLGVEYQGWRRTMAMFGLLVALGILPLAIFSCCMTMAIPTQHLVAFCSDIGIGATHGALMLSVLLGCAFLARQFWGWLSDRIGGIQTILYASVAQAVAMTGFLLTQDEVGLFAVSAAFGLGYAGLIPSYILAVRALYPVSEASWRVPVVMFAGLVGMAGGSWGAGVLHDFFGFYTPAFAAGLGFNLLNLLFILPMVLNRRSPQARLATS